MRIYADIKLENFGAWQGAEDTKDKIIEAGKQGEFERLVEELYPDGIDETQLNDLLWFDAEWIFETLGIEEEEEEEDESDN